jgi:hypothetical protein
MIITPALSSTSASPAAATAARKVYPVPAFVQGNGLFRSTFQGLLFDIFVNTFCKNINIFLSWRKNRHTFLRAVSVSAIVNRGYTRWYW